MNSISKIYIVAAILIAGILIASGCAGALVANAESNPEFNSVEAQGKNLFTRHCSSCHSTIPETVIVGPSLAGVAERAETRVEGMDADTYLRTSILLPQDYIVEGFNDLMPTTFSTTLTSEEQDALVAYLLTLK